MPFDDPQHPLDAERAILAVLLADNAASMDKIGKLEPDDFADPLNAEVFRAMLDLRDDSRPVNLVTLKSKIGPSVFDGGGPLDALRAFEFAGKMPDGHSLADVIRDASLRRQIIFESTRLADAAANLADSPATIIAARMGELDALLAKCRPAGKTTWTMPDAVRDLADFIMNGDGQTFVPTGFIDIDSRTGGIPLRTTSLLAGRPSMGKSAFAASIAYNAAMAGGGVLFVSQEMSQRQLMVRIGSMAAANHIDMRVPYKDILQRNMDDRSAEGVIAAATRNVQQLPITIEDISGVGVSDIAAKVREQRVAMERNGHTLSLVIVDHIGKMRSSRDYRDNRVQQVGDISRGLFNMAKSENVAVLALSQLNRSVESRDNKMPGLSDLRDSGDLEQDAEIVMFAYRPSYYLERTKFDDQEKEHERLQLLQECKNDMDISIAKSRNGETGVVTLHADMATNVISNARR